MQEPFENVEATPRLEDMLRRTQAALKKAMGELQSMKERNNILQAMVNKVHEDNARGERQADKRLAEANARVENLTVQLKSRALNQKSDNANAAKVPELERELKALRAELKKRGLRSSQLSADLNATRAKMEKEMEQCRAVTVAAKESEMSRENGRRQFESVLERSRSAEAELIRVKTLGMLAAKDTHKELVEVQKQALIISLQYEKQCKAMERLKSVNKDVQLAIHAARTVQARETSVVERELEQSKVETQRLGNELREVKRHLTTEVRCRENVSSQLKELREEKDFLQRCLSSEEAKRADAERKLKQTKSVLQKFRKTHQELSLSASAGLDTTTY